MEKRKQKRTSFNSPVALFTSSGEEATFKAFDYSVSGIGIIGLISTDKPKTGDVLNLRFRIAPEGNEQEVNILGIVKYVKEKDRLCAMGISFI